MDEVERSGPRLRILINTKVRLKRHTRFSPAKPFNRVCMYILDGILVVSSSPRSQAAIEFFCMYFTDNLDIIQIPSLYLFDSLVSKWLYYLRLAHFSSTQRVVGPTHRSQLNPTKPSYHTTSPCHGHSRIPGDAKTCTSIQIAAWNTISCSISLTCAQIPIQLHCIEDTRMTAKI